MILTTQTDYIGRTFGDLAAVDILADAGFDALDYTMFGMREDDCLLNTDAYKAHIRPLWSDLPTGACAVSVLQGGCGL